MESQAALLARIDGLIEDAERVERALQSQQIDPDLRKKVQARFNWRLQKLVGELKSDRGMAARSSRLAGHWVNYRKLEQEARDLFRECLGFIEGALLRSARLDDGFCSLADALLSELGAAGDVPWDRITILAEDEFFTNLAEIIRMRFPRFRLWDLPIASHEFGHYVAQRTKADMPDLFPEIVREELAASPSLAADQALAILNEQFADLFAVLSLGPAYAYTVLLLYFDPSSQDQDGKTHPCDAKRVVFILEALKLLDQAMGKPSQLAGVIAGMERDWKAAREAAGRPWDLQAEPLQTQVAQAAKWRLRDLYFRSWKGSTPLNDRLVGVRYTTWPRANRLAGLLLVDEPKKIMDQDSYSLRDVINAAWIARLSHRRDRYDQTGEISRRAVQLAQEIAKSFPSP
jgi:hypothetical protein